LCWGRSAIHLDPSGCRKGQRRVSERVPASAGSPVGAGAALKIVAGIHVGGTPQRRPRRGLGGKSANRRPPAKRGDPRFLEGGPRTIHDLQTVAGNAAVSRLIRDRDPEVPDQPAVPALQRDPLADPKGIGYFLERL
jgi:hypothetical protein